MTENEIFERYVKEHIMGDAYCMDMSIEVEKAIKKTSDYQWYCLGIRLREFRDAVIEGLRINKLLDWLIKKLNK
jgi:hypothetical protein